MTIWLKKTINKQYEKQGKGNIMIYDEKMNERIEELKKKDTLIILGIESSCDETSVAVVINGKKVLSNVVSTQIPIHAQ